MFHEHCDMFHDIFALTICLNNATHHDITILFLFKAKIRKREFALKAKNKGGQFLLSTTCVLVPDASSAACPPLVLNMLTTKRLAVVALCAVLVCLLVVGTESKTKSKGKGKKESKPEKLSAKKLSKCVSLTHQAPSPNTHYPGANILSPAISKRD